METRQLTTYHSRPNNADSLKCSILLNINRSPQLFVAFKNNSTLSRRQHTTKHCFKNLAVKVKMKTNLNVKEHITRVPVCCDPNRLINVFFKYQFYPVKKQSVQLWPIGTQYSSVHRMPNIALNTLCDPPYPCLLSHSIFSVSAFPWPRQKLLMVSQISMQPR